MAGVVKGIAKVNVCKADVTTRWSTCIILPWLSAVINAYPQMNDAPLSSLIYEEAQGLRPQFLRADIEHCIQTRSSRGLALALLQCQPRGVRMLLSLKQDCAVQAFHKQS